MVGSVNAAKTISLCRAQGVALSVTAERRLRYSPLPSSFVLAGLSEHRDEILETLLAPDPGAGAAGYDPTRDSVRVQYKHDGVSVGVWIVPDCSRAGTFDGEPAVRRSDVESLIVGGEGGLREVLAVLRVYQCIRSVL